MANGGVECDSHHQGGRSLGAVTGIGLVSVQAASRQQAYMEPELKMPLRKSSRFMKVTLLLHHNFSLAHLSPTGTQHHQGLLFSSLFWWHMLSLNTWKLLLATNTDHIIGRQKKLHED